MSLNIINIIYYYFKNAAGTCTVMMINTSGMLAYRELSLPSESKITRYKYITTYKA